MRRSTALMIGTCALLAAFFWPRHTDTSARAWLGPTETRWAGIEARAMQQWGGYFSNSGVVNEYLELRCVKYPFLKTRLNYWPGPEWHGWVEWRADRVVYVPGWSEKVRPKSLRNPVSIAAPWWLGLCPVQK